VKLFESTPRVLALCAALLAQPALAQDGGLYEDVLDPNAAFVRVIAAPNDGALVQTTAFDALTEGVSPYVVIAEPGEVKVTAGMAEGAVDVTPGSWTTFVVKADGSGVFLNDEIKANPSQSDVAFYNLSDLPTADLYVPAAKAAAVPGVVMGEGASVALKAPLTLDFEARDGETVLASVSGVELKRRDGVTFVLRGQGGTYELIAVPNAISR
jgi:alginate O-acetyltransferase complex protein AlgF